MKGIYLAAYTACHDKYDILYQDKFINRDLAGDMLDIDLSPFDFIIATPPCNFYSRAAGNRHSQYALDTAHLLPGIIDKLSYINKPVIIENVRNSKKFADIGLLNRSDYFTYFIGRHTIWSNVMFNTFIPFDYEFTSLSDTNYGSCKDLGKRSDRQGSQNVHNIIEKWLYTIHFTDYFMIRR